MKSKSDTIIFLHLPKTAGTTVHSILTWQYLGKSTFWGNSKEELDKLSTKEKRKIKLVRGHLPFGIHEDIPNVCKYITFVRNPIYHVQSKYNFYDMDDDSSIWNRKSMKDILSNEDSEILDNGQVRRISGLGFSSKSCGKKDFEKALYNVENNFEIVGTVERFDESIALISKILDWNRPLFYAEAKVNSAYNKTEKDEIVDLIRETNKWDYRLYKKIAKKLETRIGKNRNEINQKVKRMRKLCNIIAPLVKAWRASRSLFA